MEVNHALQPVEVGTHSGKVEAAIRPVPPRIRIVYEQPPEPRPFEDQSSLVDRLFHTDRLPGIDPDDLPAERAAVCHDQLDMLLQHLAARHSISYNVRKGIDYETCAVRSKLYELEQFSPQVGYWTRVQSELVKEVQQLKKQQWAEEIACWRDTGRILGTILEQWAEFSNEKRKSELMRVGD